MCITESKKDQSPNLGAGLSFMKRGLAQLGPNNWSTSQKAVFKPFWFCEKINSENLHENIFYSSIQKGLT